MGLRLNATQNRFGQARAPDVISPGIGQPASRADVSGNPDTSATQRLGMSVRGVPGRLYSCVMDFDWDGWTWELMLTRRPPDTHFSESSTPGWKSPLVRRDDDNTLVTHSELSDGAKAVLVILGTGVALGAAAMTAAPHVKSGLVSLKSKLRRQEENVTDVEPSVSLAVVVEVEAAQPDSPRLRAV
jgi:hypothetical protein